jgi:hypothetical protein
MFTDLFAAGRAPVQGDVTSGNRYSEVSGSIFFDDPNTRFDLPESLADGLKTFLRESKQTWPDATELSAKRVARGTSIGSSYMIFARLSADSAHPSLTALGRYKSPRSTSGASDWDIDCDPPIRATEMASTLALCGVAVSGACVIANEIFGQAPFAKTPIELCDEHPVVRGRSKE